VGRVDERVERLLLPPRLLEDGRQQRPRVVRLGVDADDLLEDLVRVVVPLVVEGLGRQAQPVQDVRRRLGRFSRAKLAARPPDAAAAAASSAGGAVTASGCCSRSRRRYPRNVGEAVDAIAGVDPEPLGRPKRLDAGVELGGFGTQLLIVRVGVRVAASFLLVLVPGLDLFRAAVPLLASMRSDGFVEWDAYYTSSREG
jgi:hypothetical protein